MVSLDVAERARVASDALFVSESAAFSACLHCLQAEAKLRLFRQRLRCGVGNGQRHPRWPSTSAEFNRLLEESDDLQSSVSRQEAATALPLHELVFARLGAQMQESKLQREAEECHYFEAREREDEAAIEHLLSARDSQALSWQSRKDLIFSELARADDAVAKVIEMREDLRLLRHELSELEGGTASDGRDSLRASVQETLEFGLLSEGLREERAEAYPRFHEFAEECAKAEADAERVGVAAKRRAETTSRLESEFQANNMLAERRAQLELEEIEGHRFRLQELAESGIQRDEAARKARLSHSHQLKSVKEVEKELRAVLKDVEVERGAIMSLLFEQESVMEGFTSGHDARRLRQRQERSVSDALLEEVVSFEEQLHSLIEDGHAAKLRLQETNQQLAGGTTREEALTSELSMLREETARCTAEQCKLKADAEGVQKEFCSEACLQRRERIEASTANLDTLEGENRSLELQLEHLRDSNGVWQQSMSELQLCNSQAAYEGVVKLRTGYGDLMKDLRGSKNVRGAADVSLFASRSVKSLGRQVEDLLRFLNACEQNTFSVEDEVTTFPPPPLPVALTAAFAEAYEKTPEGAPLVSLVKAEQEKLMSMQNKAAAADEKHASFIERLYEQKVSLQEEAQYYEDELAAEQACLGPSRAAIETQLQALGKDLTEQQLGKIPLMLRQMWHEYRELAELQKGHSELCSSLLRQHSRLELDECSKDAVSKTAAARQHLLQQAIAVKQLQRRVDLITGRGENLKESHEIPDDVHGIVSSKQRLIALSDDMAPALLRSTGSRERQGISQDNNRSDLKVGVGPTTSQGPAPQLCATSSVRSLGGMPQTLSGSHSRSASGSASPTVAISRATQAATNLRASKSVGHLEVEDLTHRVGGGVVAKTSSQVVSPSSSSHDPQPDLVDVDVGKRESSASASSAVSCGAAGICHHSGPPTGCSASTNAGIADSTIRGLRAPRQTSPLSFTHVGVLTLEEKQATQKGSPRFNLRPLPAGTHRTMVK